MIELPRRRFIAGLGALFAAPAIVRAASLMPVSVPRLALYTPGQLLKFRVTAVSTGAATLNINGYGMLPLYVGGELLQPGCLAPGDIVTISGLFA